MLNFGGFFEIGASYRTTKSVGLMSFVGVKNYLDVGYAYESPVQSTLNNISVLSLIHISEPTRPY